MKQTIRVGDNLSGKLHDEISSADLKGYVSVQVKNKKTGAVEHQENHNLIVYGGREWLLRRIFGNVLPNNEYALNSGIKWIGVGCGGGEAGNPLQAGTTAGHDTDLYEPCRIRFADDSVVDGINSNYASRIMPNGSRIPGYYKKISNITIKEDHANPYIENNIRKFPKIIAEIRVELSADDCNGENYTENGNLVAYQDINEVALFASDLTVDDPGQKDEYDEIFLDVVQGDISAENVYTNKIYQSANITVDGVPSNLDSSWLCNVETENAYVLQYKKEGTADWIPVVQNLQSINLTNGDAFAIIKNDLNQLSFKKNGTGIEVPGWGITLDAGNYDFRLCSVGKFKLEFKNALANTDCHKVECELQYRNYSSETWRTLMSHTFEADSTEVVAYEVPCNGPEHPDINVITNFRVRESINTTTSVFIKAVEVDATSYNLKCFVSEADIKSIKVGNYIYTDTDTESTNTIPRSAPLSIIEVYDPEIENPKTADQYTPYFIVERQESTTHAYDGDGLHGYTYKPSKNSPYTMFSRVTLSSIRKSCDREIVLVWKIYC